MQTSNQEANTRVTNVQAEMNAYRREKEQQVLRLRAVIARKHDQYVAARTDSEQAQKDLMDLTKAVKTLKDGPAQ